MKARGNTVHSEKFVLNDFGSFSGEFELGEETSLGNYSINLDFGGEGFSQTFQVEEYVAPDFKVDIKTDKDSYLQRERVGIDIDAHYYFGAPLPEAPVEWTVKTEDMPYRWHRDSTYTFGDNDGYWYQPWWYYRESSFTTGEVIAEGDGQTDHLGEYQVGFPTNFSDKGVDQRVRIEARVEDEASTKTIAHTQEFIVHQCWF